MKTVYIGAVSLIITAAALGTAFYFYNQYQQTQTLLRNPQQAAKIEAQTLIKDVGKYMELPTGEQPTLATVTDAKKLSQQPFFKKTQNGDKVLIYIQARQAILYRPATKKIIAVAPLSITEDQNQGQSEVAGESTVVEEEVTPSPSVRPSATPTEDQEPTATSTP